MVWGAAAVITDDETGGLSERGQRFGGPLRLLCLLLKFPGQDQH